MNRKLNAQHVVLFFLLLFIIGCGVDDQAPEDGQVFKIDELAQQCKVDGEKLKLFFHEKIGNDLNCLGDGLRTFSQVVLRENPKYINRPELSAFLKKFFPNDWAHLKEYLPLIFEINSFLTRTPKNRIQISKINHFIELMVIINSGIVDIIDIQERMSPETYFNHLPSFQIAITNFIVKLNGSILKEGLDYQLNLIEILNILERNTQDDAKAYKKIKSLLFIKRLFIGNSAELLTTNELLKNLNKIQELYLAADGMLNTNFKSFSNQKEQASFLIINFKKIRAALFPWNPKTKIISSEKLLTAIGSFYQGFDWSKLKVSFSNFKDKVVGNPGPSFLYSDFLKIFDIGKLGLSQFYFTQISFQKLKTLLQAGVKIEELDFPDGPEYDFFSKAEKDRYWKIFNTISLQYHYFLDKEDQQSFQYKLKRSERGFTLLTVVKWGLRIIFDSYGEGKSSLSRKQLAYFLNQYKEILVELNLWLVDKNKLINDIAEGTDLFQMTSNGNGLIEEDEITQFIFTVVHSRKVSHKLFDYLKDICQYSSAKKIDLSCYRRHFYPTFLETLAYKEQYPLLKSYISPMASEAKEQFLRDVEIKSRIQPSENIPMDKIDLTRIINAFSNLETLYIRFDHDKNQVLEKNELNQVFKLFEGIIATETGKKIGSKINRSLFIYLIKKGHAPSKAQLIKFHLFGSKRKAKLTKNKVAKILSLFGKKESFNDH
ncbi:MAG: hypothetical protein HN509_17590 [Halobacteriovoraceae bacterium]|nr:hypothetical protein [Halobacteriovoraceae bacterium]